MGGQAPDRSHLTLPEDPEEAARVLRRRLAWTQIAVGGPCFFVIVLGLVLGFLYVGRPLGDPVFWLVLVPISAVFVGYFWRAAAVLLRERGGRTG